LTSRSEIFDRSVLGVKNSLTTAAELKRVRFSYIASILEETYHALRCEWAAEINDINVRTFLTPKHAREHGYKLD